MTEEKKEKTAAELLKEKLLLKKESGAKKLPAEEIAKADDFCKGYVTFLDRAKTEREAVTYAVGMAEKAGFTAYDRTRTYQPGDRVYTVNRGKALILCVIGQNGTKNGVRLGIAHIDSPRLDLKPNPLYESNDLAFFKTHY